MLTDKWFPQPVWSVEPAPAAPPDPAPEPAVAPDPAPEPPAEAAPEPAAPATEPTDWRSGIEDEKLRQFTDRFTTPLKMAEAAFEMRQNMSKQVTPLGEEATDEDVAKFRKAMGVPEKAEEYQITPPEDYELSDADKQILEAIAPIAHEHNIPAPAFDEFASTYLQMGIEMRARADKELDQFQREAEEALKKEWGPDTDRNFEIAKRFTDTGGDAFVEFLSTAKLETGGVLGDHPAMVKFLAENGSRFLAEGSMEFGGTRAQRQTAQEQILAMEKEHPPGSPGYNNPAHQRKLTELYEQVYGKEQIVGAETRTV